MLRIEFTQKIISLLQLMIAHGEHPLIDYVKRSDEEQVRLFQLGLSKKDGYARVSKHQRGKAMDIYFTTPDGKSLVPPNTPLEFWHDRWMELGGNPMITWDKNHFEVD